ncbi:MAG: type II toxin-antitoxin system prevent-host-death family antitoxin [Mariprofundaceae bacterium]
MSSVGAYEAKTHLPQLLERVASGERITITKHGYSVAVLQPVEGGESVTDAIRGLKAFRRGKRLSVLSIKEMIEEGRR